MKKIMIFLLVSLVIALLLLSGCKKPIITPVSETACIVDSDCACGTHITTGDCFTGNKAFVNTETQCPDFCTGIGAMFETKCVDKECKQVKKETVPPENPPVNPPQTPPEIPPGVECVTDNDCAPADCCHAASCVAKSKQPDCTDVACTLVCQPQTMDCGGFCACNNGKCIAELNDL